MSAAAPTGRPARTVHGHLVDLSGVVLLDVSEDPDVVVLHKVYGHTFTAVTSGSTNPGGGQRLKVVTQTFIRK